MLAIQFTQSVTLMDGRYWFNAGRPDSVVGLTAANRLLARVHVCDYQQRHYSR